MVKNYKLTKIIIVIFVIALSSLVGLSCDTPNDSKNSTENETDESNDTFCVYQLGEDFWGKDGAFIPEDTNSGLEIPYNLTPVKVLQEDNTLFGEGSVFVTKDSLLMLLTAQHLFSNNLRMYLKVIFRNQTFYVAAYDTSVKRDVTIALLTTEPIGICGKYDHPSKQVNERTMMWYMDTIAVMDCVTGVVYNSNIISQANLSEKSITNYIVIDNKSGEYKPGVSGRLFKTKNNEYFILSKESLILSTESHWDNNKIALLCPVSKKY